MGIFDSIQNIIGDISNSASETVGGLSDAVTDNQIIQGVQDQVTGVTENAGETISGAQDQITGVADDINNKLSF